MAPALSHENALLQVDGRDDDLGDGGAGRAADEKGRDTTHWGSDDGLARALRLDLARLDLANSDADGKDRRSQWSTATGHELLREVQTTIASSSKRRDPKAWVERLRTSSSRSASNSPAGSCNAASSPKSTRSRSAS